jgi:hypothetical protein
VCTNGAWMAPSPTSVAAPPPGKLRLRADC